MRTALLTLAILAAGAAPAAASDPVDEPFSTDTVAETHRSAHPEMSAAQARLAADEAPERDTLRAAARRAAGHIEAARGMTRPTNVLHVNATTAAAVDDAEELGESKDLDVRGHLVARSFDQLESQAGTLRSGTGALGEAAEGQVGLDVRANKTVIAVSAAQRAALLPAANAANVKLIVDPKLAVEPDSCAARDVCDGGLAGRDDLARGRRQLRLLDGLHHRRHVHRQPFRLHRGALLERPERHLGHRRTVDRPAGQRDGPQRDRPR